MNTKKAFKNFNTVVAIWEKELENYDMVQLSQKEDNESWSMGQLYKHLIDGTLNFHLKQVHLCLNSADHKTKKKNAKGFVAYHIIKGFPPIKIKVPASETYTPKPAESKKELTEGFHRLKQEMQHAFEHFKNDKRGKTAHPGFSYLNASEWFCLIPMHFKHHLRQKERLDLFLRSHHD